MLRAGAGNLELGLRKMDKSIVLWCMLKALPSKPYTLLVIEPCSPIPATAYSLLTQLVTSQNGWQHCPLYRSNQWLQLLG